MDVIVPVIRKPSYIVVSVHANFSNIICFTVLFLYNFALVLFPEGTTGIDLRGLEYTMASASVNAHASTKETTNYARLCRLMVDVGSQALRDRFDKINPPASLHDKLSRHPVRASLEMLYKGKHKILNPIQWVKLYPSCPSSVSSQNFDVTLLMVLLRNFSGLKPPATGWNSPPPATDTSTEADIIRVKVFRDEIYNHASKAYVDDHTFHEYWQDIQQTLMRLGGERYGPHIDKLKVDRMDPDIGLHYQELLKHWIEDEGKVDQTEGRILHKQYLHRSALLRLYRIPQEVSHVQAT